MQPPSDSAASLAVSESAASPLTFPPELPISARVRDIAAAIDAHPVIIVAGATGSGKTTQLPKIALAMGRGLEKRIGVTQPRRLAATSVAARVASELGSPLGTDVGYHVRFDDRTSPATYVKFMTDGILLAEINGDPLLKKYDTIILDEAHERSLTIDFLLGWMKRILPSRPDLKVIISSATIETDRFSEFFGNAPVIQVEGRTFPVEVLYEPPDADADLPEAVARAVENVTSLDPRGDILVFLPGEREIRETENALNALQLRHTVIQPLYARLTGSEQAKVFTSIAQRRVILATNVAETSVTIPGIVYVVDTGVARLSRYDARSGTTRLQIEGISQASADQRKGRCGRVREGICVRLYDEQSFEARPRFTDPEIKRTGLAGVILRMKSLDLGAVEEFPFLDPPHSRTVAEGYRVLEELGAIDAARNLTSLGEQLARFPVDPRIGRMILAGAELGCLRDVLIVAAALNIQDPRERPREAQQKADELHRRFRDERSDFTALLRIWTFVKQAEAKSTSVLRRTCRENFLSFVRVREWFDVHHQLEEAVRELKLPGSGERGAKPVKEQSPEIAHDALHRALLTGLLSKIGFWNPEHRVFIGAKQTRFMLHPSSSLARKPPAWVMAFELVETSQLFARMASKIDPEWLMISGAHLMKSNYGEPHWSEKSARASIKEHSTLFGLSVFRDRSVDYASVAPDRARAMFLDHALVRGEYTSRGDFQRKNQALLGRVAILRDKARRSDMLADDDSLRSFFDKRVPAQVVNGKLFETWRHQAEQQDPNILELRLEDVLANEADLRPQDYPDHVDLHGTKVAVRYRFDPSAEDDGITLDIPLVLVPQLDPGELDWTIPGRQREKFAALLYELPRAMKRELGSHAVPDLARILQERLVPFRGPMIPALAQALSDIIEGEVPEDAFRADAVATYLRSTVRIIDAEGKTLASSRDVDSLFQQFGARARAVWKAAAAAAPSSAIGPAKLSIQWDFGDIPEHVERRVANANVRSFPALVDRGNAVELVHHESQAAARDAMRGGLRRLFAIASKGTLSSLGPRVPSGFTSVPGVIPSRAQTDAFRNLVLERVLDEAFGLTAATLPRTQEEYRAGLTAGTPRIATTFQTLIDAIKTATFELAATELALKNAARHPSGTLAANDIRKQITDLFSETLIRDEPIARVQQYPRYLRSAQMRLQRAMVDPRKDASKLEPFARVWSAFVAKRTNAKAQGEARALRWAFEELRVAIFAPELKPAVPVSIEKVSALVSALR